MEYMAETGHFQKCLRKLLPSLTDSVHGCNWSFYPGVKPILFPELANISAQEILGISL
jgi:hypothetical protein